MYFELALAAYLIDYLAGEFSVKHPVVWMGAFISAFEKRFYRDRVGRGAVLVAGLIALVYGISLGLVCGSTLLPAQWAFLILALLASTGLAMTMLHQEVAEVLTAASPRQALSRLVSRDTEAMTNTEIHKALLETWAENLSDGVIAPLFYLVLFGLPGLAVYKAINTLDSMVGYKTEHYRHYGKAAARLDDLANFIPARLTALLIILIGPERRNAWRITRRDGSKLESPNAGWPIAALAGALGVCLGGDASYHGRIKPKPTLGEPFRLVTADTVLQALRLKKRLDVAVVVVLLVLL